MAYTDDRAFNSMQASTKERASNLFTESEYNTLATDKERHGYDIEAYKFLQSLYQEDLDKHSDIEDWDFDRYLSNLSSRRLEEKFLHSKKGDPDFYSKAGDMLRSVYSDDADQLKLSARNVSAQMTPAGEGDFESRAKAARDRSNVSIKAPGAREY